MPSLSPSSSAISHLDARLRDRLWRGDALVASATSIASGFPALDAQLPGSGWPTRCLTELLLPAPGIGEMRLLAPCLAHLAHNKRQIIVLAPSAADHGLLYPDGWEQLGIDASRLILIQAEKPADRLWAIEQSLKSTAFGALLAWVPEARPDALRRLQLAAASADGLSFLLRPAQAQDHASPAPLRLLLGRTDSIHNPDRSLSVRLLKRRGPLLQRALLLNVAEPRLLRTRTATMPGAGRPGTVPSFTSSTVLRHAVGRPPLPDIAPRSHPTPTA